MYLREGSVVALSTFARVSDLCFAKTRRAFPKNNCVAHSLLLLALKSKRLRSRVQAQMPLSYMQVTSPHKWRLVVKPDLDLPPPAAGVSLK